MGQCVDLVPGDVREDISREKMTGLFLDRGGHPLPLLPGGHPLTLLSGERGNDGLEAKLCLKAGKDRKPHDSSSTYSSVK